MTEYRLRPVEYTALPPDLLTAGQKRLATTACLCFLISSPEAPLFAAMTAPSGQRERDWLYLGKFSRLAPAGPSAVAEVLCLLLAEQRRASAHALTVRVRDDHPHVELLSSALKKVGAYVHHRTAVFETSDVRASFAAARWLRRCPRQPGPPARVVPWHRVPADAFHPSRLPPGALAELRASIDTPHACSRVLLDANSVVGWLHVVRRPRGLLYNSVYVAPAHQPGLGFAALLASATDAHLEHCADLPAFAQCDTRNRAAMRLYERRFFPFAQRVWERAFYYFGVSA